LYLETEKPTFLFLLKRPDFSFHNCDHFDSSAEKAIFIPPGYLPSGMGVAFSVLIRRFSMTRLLTALLSLLLLVTLSCRQGESTTSDEDLRQRAQQLAQETIITDGHVDLPYRLRRHPEDVSQRTERGEFDYVRAREGGLDAPFMSIYIPASYQETGGAKALADSLIDLVEGLARAHPNKFALASSPADIRRNFQSKLISLPMGMENGAPIEGNLENVKHFHRRGIRYITLTHSKDNHISDSSYDTTRTWQGLSPFGYQVVEEMNRTGIMVDVSHISDSAFYQVMRHSKAPAIDSHSSCRHFTPGFERNMSDEMIKALAAKGGVIQINFGSTFLDTVARRQSEENARHLAQWREDHQVTPDDPQAQAYAEAYAAKNPVQSDVTVVADHIDRVVQLVGVNHVGLGSDFDGVGPTLPSGLKDVSQYPNLIYHLLQRGYSEADIRKICHENVFRVWNKVEQVARESGRNRVASSASP
jgi:membrane dipeptidase